jgi:hypothetical protein
MTAFTAWINGFLLGEYKGGYTPFSFELTPHLQGEGENVLVVQLDSTERSDIPPFGSEIDYMTFGGIYREAALRVVPTTYLDNTLAKPINVLSSKPSLEVDCFLAGQAVVCSNCNHLKFYIRVNSVESNPWVLLAELNPASEEFNHLTYPPFILDRKKISATTNPGWGDLRIDGYLKGEKVISKSLSGRGVDTKFKLLPDDTSLLADGADATRVVMRVTDEFGAVRTYANDAITLHLEGPADLIGDKPFSLIGGTGAVWVRARETSGTVRLTATHPRLGSQTIQILLSSAPSEME